MRVMTRCQCGSLLIGTTKCYKCNPEGRVLAGAGTTLIGNGHSLRVRDDAFLDLGRQAWQALHSMQTATLEQLKEWKKMVPSYGCECKYFADAYMASNPPPHPILGPDEFFRWTWEFHCAVDEKTGDTPISFDQAQRERNNNGQEATTRSPAGCSVDSRADAPQCGVDQLHITDTAYPAA